MNMMTTDAGWTQSEDSAVSKLVAAWEQKLTKNTAKAAGLGLMAVSLAACGDSDGGTTTGGGGGGGGGTTTTPVTVDGADNDGDAYDGSSDSGETTIELKGNTDPNVDAGEWINYETLLIRDANGDFTITDIQASENDASDGAAGTDIMLEDIGQNTAGTTTINFDTQAIDEPDTVVNVSLDEVAGNVLLTGSSSIETVNIAIADGTNEATDIDTLAINGVTTLNISGGIAGQSFTIDNALNTSITTLDASAAVGDLDLDVTGGSGGSYALGSGDDMLEMDDSYDDGDTVTGGAGADTVAMNFQAATIREGTMSGVETLNAVFGAAATFDGSDVTDLTTANLGLDGFDATVETASSADADFNDMNNTFTTVNIHATQRDVEVDYQSGAEADLTINFENDSGAITVGDSVFDTAIQLIDVKDLTINHMSSDIVIVGGEINLDDGETETLTITTANQDGDLILIADNGDGAFVNTNALTDVSIMAVDGDMDLNSDLGAFSSSNHFIGDGENLQTYRVSSDDADLLIGTVGDANSPADNAATELEIIEINMIDEATLHQEDIWAYDGNLGQGANISLVDITASDKNTVSAGGPFNVNASVVINGLYAEQVDNMVLEAADDGNIVLEDQQYVLNTTTFLGSGDILIEAGSALTGFGLQQTSAADASGHTGYREFRGNSRDDTFYGSDAGDTVVMSGGGNDTYFDAGGDDVVTVSGVLGADVYDDGSASLTDTGSASNDTYILAGTGGTGATSNTQFFVGAGTDSAALTNGTVHVDFADRDGGLVNLTSFTNGGDSLSFNGMGDITAVTGTAFVVGATEQTLNVNDVYVFDDGDLVPVTGGSNTIADYTNMTDVAAFLNEAFADAINNGDEAVFVINNGGTTANAGDDLDAYIYYYEEATGGGDGIQVSELTLIATADGSTVFSGDIV